MPVRHALCSFSDARVEQVSISPPSLLADVRRRIELIQDFEMPTVCTTIKVSKDGQYILATGKHFCGSDLSVFLTGSALVGKGHPFVYLSVSLYTFSDIQKYSEEFNEHSFICDLDSALNSLLCLFINLYLFKMSFRSRSQITAFSFYF